MIDHVSIPVRDLTKAAAFYEAVLAPLGLARLVSRKGTIGFGKRYPEFWLNQRMGFHSVQNPGGHVCLRAPDEGSVRSFHAAGLANGGCDEGAPGQRPAAMTTYFGAFILDPDGNKLEAVTFPKLKPADASGLGRAADLRKTAVVVMLFTMLPTSLLALLRLTRADDALSA